MITLRPIYIFEAYMTDIIIALQCILMFAFSTTNANVVVVVQ